MNDLEMRMRYFESLHPGCIFLYFVCMIGLSLVCFHPVMGLISCMGAVLFQRMEAGSGLAYVCRNAAAFCGCGESADEP